MKIIFKKPTNNKDILFISIDKKNQNEIIREGDKKTFYLKVDEKINLRKLFLLIRKIIQTAKSSKAEKICLDFFNLKFPNIKINDIELAEIIGSQLKYANYEFTQYKSKKENTFIKEAYIILNTDPKERPLETLEKPKGLSFGEIEKAVLKGNTIAEEINKTRDLSNTPGGDMTPKILAEKAKEAVKGLPVKVTVWGEKEMAKQKMHAILSVGRGSDEESKFIIMEYWGALKEKKSRRSEKSGSRSQASGPIVLVGKGVTFDTGGINLKPSNGLLGMNMDMSGGASVIHTMALIAKNKIKRNVIALIPSVENMASGKSYRPGDVIHSLSGQTIEVLNTDAEGRVILADALTYAQKYKPEVIIDVATLTGASLVALGEKMSAIFSDDDNLCLAFEKLGEKTGEYFWRLPLWEEYEAEIKGSLGDWTNIHNKDSRYGGATYGAIFLKQFVGNFKWLHIDMAPRMVSVAGDNLASGSTGTPVYSLFKFIEEYKNE